MTIKRNTVGVLGGMGPYATNMFYKLVLDLTMAEKDWEYPHLLIDSASYIPSRTRNFLYGEKSPVQDMIEVCGKMEKYPVDYIVIPCNSACYYIEEIQDNINIPIISIIDVTVKELTKQKPSTIECIVLGGRVTYSAQTYEQELIKNNFNLILHDENIQIEIEKIIELIKVQNLIEAQENYNKLAKEIIKIYKNFNVILGCTELSYLHNPFIKMLVVDSNTALAKYIVRNK